jgi:hypothetical protein
MAKSKKRAKVQKRGKLPRGKSATRGKARKAVQAKTVARAKPKKAARKAKQPVTPVVETVAAEVIEQPAPGVITVTEVEETEIRMLPGAQRMPPLDESWRTFAPRSTITGVRVCAIRS